MQLVIDTTWGAGREGGKYEEQRKVCKRDYGDCFQLEGGKIK